MAPSADSSGAPARRKSDTAGPHAVDQADAGKTVARFEIRFRRYLDADGKLASAPPAFARDSEVMLSLYKAMTRTRTFDSKAIALQRTGQLGTFASSLGQEAVSVGVASVMTADDVLVPYYREAGAKLWRGITLTELFLYWGGDERGSAFEGSREDFPICIPIATQALHATGVATAFKLRRQPRAAVCFVGDGATSKGDVMEAINVAGAWNLPVVFIVVNNKWAISIPLEHQTAAETLAQKAILGGFVGEQVDGNDVIAVRHAAEAALAKARAGGGPSLIEALTYRLGDHTTADDARRYRTEDELSAAWALEPLKRLRTYLGNQGWWLKEDEEALLEQSKDEVEKAAADYLSTPPEPVAAMFDYLYETLPEAYEPQRRMAEEEDARKKADG